MGSFEVRRRKLDGGTYMRPAASIDVLRSASPVSDVVVTRADDRYKAVRATRHGEASQCRGGASSCHCSEVLESPPARYVVGPPEYPSTILTREPEGNDVD